MNIASTVLKIAFRRRKKKQKTKPLSSHCFIHNSRKPNRMSKPKWLAHPVINMNIKHEILLNYNFDISIGSLVSPHICGHRWFHSTHSSQNIMPRPHGWNLSLWWYARGSISGLYLGPVTTFPQAKNFSQDPQHTPPCYHTGPIPQA